MKVIGWIGTALVIVAYYPQIRHLLVERCAWGISVSTWLIWLASSALLFGYCVFRRETLMCVVQGVNIAAIVTTIALVRRSNNVCPYHRRMTEERGKARAS
ncbi:MAG: PQ-loop repeat-containing protein [Pyrinomonadaceae bacterium]